MGVAPAQVGVQVALASDSEVSRWSGKALSSGRAGQRYGFTDLDGSRREASRFFADAYFGDREADVEDFR